MGFPWLRVMNDNNVLHVSVICSVPSNVLYIIRVVLGLFLRGRWGR